MGSKTWLAEVSLKTVHRFATAIDDLDSFAAVGV